MDPMKNTCPNQITTAAFRRLAVLLTALLLCLSAGTSAFSESAAVDAASSESAAWLAAEAPVREGDRTVVLRADAGIADLRINVFAGEEELAVGAEREGELLTVTLGRALRAGESLTVAAEGTDESRQAVSCRLDLIVSGLFQSRLTDLRKRVDSLWPLWWDEWRAWLTEGKVYIPLFLSNVPFLTWPDEAPAMAVAEEDGRMLIRLSEDIPEDWRICVGSGIPVEYAPCAWDDTAGAWVAETEFESVYLISDYTDSRFGLSVSYPADSGFLPSYPVLDWNLEAENEVWGFACYGWGNARSFEGGMVAQVSSDAQWYAEYNSNGFLTSYYAIHLGCQFDTHDQLIEGTLPEGYVSPVVH